jgi:TonB family protein
MRSLGCAVFAIALTAPVVPADVTVRYRSDSKLVPPAMADRTIRIKDDRARFSIGNLSALANFSKQELTICDPVRKTSATIPLSQYNSRIAAAMPEMQAAMAQMVDPAKIRAAFTAPRRAAAIQGIAAEERELTITVPIAIPGGDASSKAQMKLAMRIWMAPPAEFLRKPELRDLAAFSQWQKYFLDTAGTFPGWHSAFEKMIRSGGVVLRTHTEVRTEVPGVASADAGPVMETNEEVAEIATGPIDESLFRIPPGYTAVPFEGLIRGALETPSDLDPAAEASKPRTNGVKTYVPEWTPIEDTEPVYPETARAQNVHGVVNLLVTLDPQGSVIHTEVLSGPEVLRPAAIAAVRQWRYRPVMRDGAPVAALINADVEFRSGRPGEAAEQDVAGIMAVATRRMQLERELPRSPQQILEDLEQDMDGGDDSRQFYMLDELTKAAAHAGAFDKAAGYAEELLSEAAKNTDDPNYGNAIHDANIVLGRVALRQGDAGRAGMLLLEAGRTPGSTQLNNFGPDMMLARELLEKGERDLVLQYFVLCRRFWARGSQQLDAWTKTVREGGIPKFGANLR